MDIRYNIPKTWNDLNRFQMIKFSRLINNDVNIKMFNLQLFCIVLTPNLSFKTILKLLFALVYIPIDAVIKEVEFLKESVTRTVFPESFKIGKMRLYGPDIRMRDVTIYEFSLAYFFYGRFCNSKSEDDLNGLVSCLYRPRVKGVKQPYTKQSLEVSGRYITKLNYNEKYMVFLAFQGSLKTLAGYYKHVFKTTPEKSNNRTWDDVIHEYSELKNNGLGNLYNVRETNLYDFMKKLNSKLKK